MVSSKSGWAASTASMGFSRLRIERGLARETQNECMRRSVLERYLDYASEAQRPCDFWLDGIMKRARYPERYRHVDNHR